MQVVGIGGGYTHHDSFAGRELVARRQVDVHQPINFRSVTAAAPERHPVFDSIHDHLLHRAYLACQACGTDFSLVGHQPLEAVLLGRFIDRVRQGIGGCPLHRRVLKAPDPVNLCFREKIQQVLEFGFGLSRVADDERAAKGQIWTDVTPGSNAVEGVFGRGGAAHAF